MKTTILWTLVPLLVVLAGCASHEQLGDEALNRGDWLKAATEYDRGAWEMKNKGKDAEAERLFAKKRHVTGEPSSSPVPNAVSATASDSAPPREPTATTESPPMRPTPAPEPPRPAAPTEATSVLNGKAINLRDTVDVAKFAQACDEQRGKPLQFKCRLVDFTPATGAERPFIRVASLEEGTEMFVDLQRGLAKGEDLSGKSRAEEWERMKREHAYLLLSIMKPRPGGQFSDKVSVVLFEELKDVK